MAPSVILTVDLCLALCLGLCIGSAGTALAADKHGRAERSRDMSFAAEMAEKGLWREALFRWQRLLRDWPDDPYLLNNIGVAKEALGDREGAKQAYEQAARLSHDPKMSANFDLFRRSETPPPDANEPPPGSTEPPPQPHP